MHRYSYTNIGKIVAFRSFYCAAIVKIAAMVKKSLAESEKISTCSTSYRSFWGLSVIPVFNCLLSTTEDILMTKHNLENNCDSSIISKLHFALIITTSCFVLQLLVFYLSYILLFPKIRPNGSRGNAEQNLNVVIPKV